MDEVELKPCPFCGSEQVTTAPDHEFGGTTWDVICKACGARVSSDLEEQAIAAWNTRQALKDTSNAE
jgi:Lar family restriction alleviation protein